MRSVIHTVYLGNKSIQIESSSEGKNAITVIYKNLHIRVQLDYYTRPWLADVLRQAARSQGKVGFLGKCYGKEEHVFL